MFCSFLLMLFLTLTLFDVLFTKRVQSLGGSEGKESACNAGDLDSILGLGRIPWKREWLPTPVFWSGELHGQGSLASYSPWGCKESDMTE